MAFGVRPRLPAAAAVSGQLGRLKEKRCNRTLSAAHLVWWAPVFQVFGPPPADPMAKRSSRKEAPVRKTSKEAATRRPARQSRRRRTSEIRSDAAAETDCSPIVA